MKERKTINLSRKRLANTSLSSTELSTILGGLLGDGSLKFYPGYKNARYTLRHSIREQAYFYAKCAMLRALSSEKSISKQTRLTGWSTQDTMQFCSKALPSLTLIHSITHSGNRLECKRKWLNHCTAHSLAIWWFDDGSIIGNGRKGILCTHGFSKAECEILAKYLLVVWGIRVNVSAVRRKKRATGGILPKEKTYYCLRMSTLSLQSFLKIILPYIPCAEMFYKCAIRYKSIDLQQRWISQMLQGCPIDLRDRCQEYVHTTLHPQHCNAHCANVVNGKCNCWAFDKQLRE